MIVDSSALLAILRDEQDAERFAVALQEAAQPMLSAATYLETSIVAGPSRHADLDHMVSRAGIELRTFDDDQARVAREAYARFGKGSGSPAQLNFGDCFAYALAKVTGRPLLFKGEDFLHTDVMPVRRPS